ncbi:HAD family hydrolase [Ktedonosporobacter rubrisoli]|nr:HAD family hydrolase [Ktedonosporobacter rubrisoli]
MATMENAATRWATFDCYGTLVDWEQGMQETLQSVIQGDVSALLRRYHELEPEVEAERPFRLYRFVLAKTLKRAAASLKLPLAPGAEHALAENLPRWPVFPDVGPALAALKAQGWKLALLSNIDKELIAHTLATFPVAVDLVITAEDVKSYKPGLAHFLRFQDTTAATRKNWVHVARSYFHDITPIHELGILTAWINRGGSADSAPLATVTLPDLTSLPDVLEQLIPAGKEL